VSEEFLLRWVILPPEPNQSSQTLELWVTNGNNHKTNLNGIVWLDGTTQKPLRLQNPSQGPTGFGPWFELEAYQTKVARLEPEPGLVLALQQNRELHCFLSHLPWPKAIRPIAMVNLEGNWIDQEALGQIKPEPNSF